MMMDDRMLTREEFIQTNQKGWIEEGEIYKKARLANGLTRKKVSSILQVSESKLYSFEHGNPIKEVNLLKAALRLIYKDLDQKAYKKILQYEKVREYLIDRKSRNEDDCEEYSVCPQFGNLSSNGIEEHPVSSTFGKQPPGFGGFAQYSSSPESVKLNGGDSKLSILLSLLKELGID